VRRLRYNDTMHDTESGVCPGRHEHALRAVEAIPARSFRSWAGVPSRWLRSPAWNRGSQATSSPERDGKSERKWLQKSRAASVNVKMPAKRPFLVTSALPMCSDDR
jgi:hypothetical protein